MFVKKQENAQLAVQADRLATQSPEGVRKKILNYSFLLSDRIGKGYSSVVYRGLNELTGAEVAIKVIELRSLRDETSRAMLRTEIECLKETRHPSLLRYENSFSTQNNCYIITEYCASGDLAKAIKLKGRLPEAEAGRLFLQILDGYEHLLGAGFIHRDLKPANILVADEGSLRIADFGFSKRRTPIDRDNYNVGTPIYMPRESLATNTYNEKTDVWALGITLYEMVFGTVPFRGKNQQELRAEIERGMVVFPDCTPVSEEFKAFIGCCLHADSFLRASVREMQRHPWVLRMRSVGREVTTEGEGKLERREEEKEMRISLPNEGVSHNRSREYFEKPGLLENRRSISSMQKLKLCHPKKGSQINLPASLPRQPLNNRSLAAINLTMHRKDDSLSLEHAHKPHREPSIAKQMGENKENMPSNRASLSISALPTMQSFNGKEGKNSLTKEEGKVKDENRLKTGIDKIVSLINYFRLLFKIAEKVKQAGEEVLDADIKAELGKLGVAVLSGLARNFQLHLQCLASKENLFCLNSQFWTEFVGSERWTMYSFVIKRYQVKYEPFLRQEPGESSACVEAVGWRRQFLGFYGRVRELESSKVLLVRERYALCEVAYLLERLVEMDEVVVERGWQDFTEKYCKTEEFVPEGFSISMANYYEVDEEVRNRYALLRLRL